MKQHGLTALRRKVAARGLAAVDGRTLAARAVKMWKQELLTDLGGEENLSTQKRALVELVVRTRLMVDHVDAYLMELGSPVNRRFKRLHPIVGERQRLVDSLAKLLGQLGLERQMKPVEEIDAFLVRRAEEKESMASEGEPETAADNS
jgi:hypothetical protein